MVHFVALAANSAMASGGVVEFAVRRDTFWDKAGESVE
jgi:hypothetical protein